MPTSRDLVEAQAFERRRIVRAFLSGDSRGPAREPVRTARWLVVSAILAVVLTLGAAASRALL